MKEEAFKFRIQDFLAYLFPGTIMILAVAAFLSLSPFRNVVVDIPLNLTTGLLLIACAYFAGISLSSLMAIVEKYFEKFFGLTNPIHSLQLEGFEDDVMKAFNEIFGDHGVWDCNHFYLARALMRERMPSCAAEIERQDSLRQIRRNSVLPVLFLGLAGVLAGAKTAITGHDITFVVWGAILVLVSILIAGLVTNTLVKNGMYGNRKREVREVCSGLLAYYHHEKNQLKTNR